MSKRDKLIARMRNNPRDWRIEDLNALAAHLGLLMEQNGTSHRVFRSANGRMLSVPAKRPIQPVYITRFLEYFVEEMLDEEPKDSE